MLQTKRISVYLRIVLPLIVMAVLSVAAIVYTLHHDKQLDLERTATAQASATVEILAYLVESNAPTETFASAITAQGEREGVTQVLYAEWQDAPLIRNSSSGEWDGKLLAEMEDKRLSKQVADVFGSREPAYLYNKEKQQFYYSIPVEYYSANGSNKPRDGVIAIALDTSSLADSLSEEAWQNALVLGIAVILLPLLFAIILRTILLSPLRVILEVVEDRISGNTHTYVELERRDELGQLARALNQLFEKQRDAEKGIRYSSDLIQTVIDNVPGVVFWKDRNLTYLGCNRAFANMEDDGNIDHIIGRKDAELKLSSEVAELYARHDAAVMQQNTTIVQEEFLLMPDGTPCWIEMHKIPLRDERKRVIGVLGFCFDITQRRHAEQEQEQSSRLNKLLFELATGSKLNKNSTLPQNFRKVCGAVTRSLEIDRASIWQFSEDKTAILLYTAEGKAAEDLKLGMSHKVTDHQAYYGQILSSRPVIAYNSHCDPLAGTFLHSRLSAQDSHAMAEVPIIVGGTVWGTLCLEKFRHHAWNQLEEQFVRSLSDVLALIIASEQNQQMTSKIREQKDFLELILEATHEGIWDWRIKENTVSFSSRWKSMLGYNDLAIEDSYESFLSLLHPDDVEPTKQAVNDYLKSPKEELYETSFRMRTYNDEYRWILSRGKSTFDSAGNPIRFVGTHTDITDFTRAEEEIFRQKYLVDRIIENLPVGMFAKNVRKDFRYTIWNRQMERIFDRPRAQMLGLNDYDLFNKEEADYRRFTDNQLLASDAPVEIYEEIQSEWGRPVSVNIKKFTIFGQDNEPEMVIGIVDDISDLMDAQRELEEHRHHLEGLVEEQTHDLILAKEEAEKANQAKSDFLANMSHELRTPMHAIISYSQLGVDKVASAETDKIRKYFSNIHTSGKRLLHLLNDLLDLSKMEAGQMEYSFASNNMEHAISTIREEVKTLLEQKFLTLEIIKETVDMTAWFDENRLMQVLMNLLSNAIKFTDAHKTIRIILADELLNDDHGVLPALSVSILDEGVGIPDMELLEIFDKFSQSTRTKTGAGGTGLGLAITREIIAAHHGIIWAENNSSGGAKFTLVIPRKRTTIG